MLAPISWLRAYTDINVSDEVFAERMIMSGSNIETVTKFGEELQNVVIGRVQSVVPHEDSDHLSVCMVDVGKASEENPLQIVCGASNVIPGVLVPVALHGSVLPGGFKIKKGKLRGVVSNGMICAANELGFDDKVSPLMHKDGIWILPEEFEIGDEIVEAMGLDETVVDFEITPNRSDCLSMLGLAREVAATFGTELKYPDTTLTKEDASTNASDSVKVEINRPDLCNRYTARIAKDIEIKESPWWLQKRLMFSGMRPINNIVDITNYVMLEYGHPIHAFDIRTIAQATIIVDTPADKVEFTTLDGAERKIEPDMLLINDAEKGIAVAGVMGGLNSEIESDTNTIIVESASFNADSVRITSKKLGIRSEASSRYEKGVSSELSGDAANRVCKLIEETNSGVVTQGIVDNYPNKPELAPITVRTARMNQLLGTKLSQSEMVEILKKLEMDVEEGDGVMHVTPNHVRLDLKEEVDFSEEIGRIFGYDKLDTTLHADAVQSENSKSWETRALVRNILCGFGLSEIQTYSFTSPKSVDKIALAADSSKRDFVKLINPLGEENSVMRTVLLPNILEVLATNRSKSNESVQLFEVGNTFINNSEESDENPAFERISLSIAGYGDTWDFFALKGVICSMLERLGYEDLIFEPASDQPSYHPGRCAKITASEADGGEVLGYMGQLNPDVIKNYDFDRKVCASELDLVSIIEKANLHRQYEALDKYPAVMRDVALLATEDVTVGSVEAIIKNNGGKILESVKLFDVYRGKQIPEGHKSLAFNLTYRADDRTLTDEEVTKVHDAILQSIKENTGATLREI